MPITEKQRKALEDIRLIEKIKADSDLVLFDYIKESKEQLESVNGEDGDKGDKGDKGSTGPNGDKGERGKEGKTGKKGKDGTKGERGVVGFDGLDGTDGKDGEQGEQGDKGDIPKHKWKGTKLSFENSDGSFGKWVNLGKKGGALSQIIQNVGTITKDETDPIFTAWLATPPNISTFTNDSGYIIDISGQDLSTADNSTSQFITQTDIDWATNVPLNETDPIFSAWLATPPNISIFTNDSGYLTPATALFTRTGTTLSTTNAGDDLSIDGNVYTNKMLGVNLETGDTPSHEIDVKGDLHFKVIAIPITSSMTYTLGGAGNLENGTRQYKIMYTSDRGDTSLSATYLTTTVVDNTIAGQIILDNIPVSSDSEVTGRKIFRGMVGGSTSSYYYVAEITDNTTTTYTDNIADTSLPSGDYRNIGNRTAGRLYKDGSRVAYFGETNVSLGLGAYNPAGEPTGYFNFGLGLYALNKITTGSLNTGVGTYSLFNLLYSSNCVGVGSYSGYSISTGYDNITIGVSAGRAITTASRNVIVGNVGLYKLDSNYNVSVGFGCGYNATVGSGVTLVGNQVMYKATNITGTTAIGYASGYYPNALVANACTTSTDCTFIGMYTGLGSTTQRTNAMALGYRATVDADNTCAIGGSGTYGTDLFVTRKQIRSKYIYTETDTTELVYLHLCDSTTAFTLTVTDGGQDGEEQKIVNRGAGTVTLSGNISSITATSILYQGETIVLSWDSTDGEWQ